MSNPSTCGVELEFLCVFEGKSFINSFKFPDLVGDEDKGQIAGLLESSHTIWQCLNQAGKIWKLHPHKDTLNGTSVMIALS